MNKETATEKALLRAQQKLEVLETMLEDKSRELFYEKEELRKSHRELTTVFNGMLNAIIVTDPLGYIIKTNQATERIFKTKLEDEKLKITDVVNIEEDIINSKVSFKRECVIKKIGSPCFVSASYMFNKNGESRGAVYVLHDLTEHKKLEGQLLQAQKLEAIGRLSAGIAHELNTPMQFVNNNLSFISEEFENVKNALLFFENQVTLDQNLKSQMEKFDLDFLLQEIPNALSESLEGAQKIIEIVRSMKSFSHPGSKEKTLYNLNEALKSTTVIARSEWRDIAEIKFNLKQDLPDCNCLPALINQVFLNIIINATHAIKDQNEALNRDKGEISISTYSKDKNIIVEFQDNGKGIKEENLSKVFDPFFTTKEVGKGTGQGLSFVYRIMYEDHGGSVEISSKESKGTLIRLIFPNNPS